MQRGKFHPRLFGMPEFDVTLSLPPQPAKPTESMHSETPWSVAGYEVREIIGRGGMGEVVLAYDPEIGRDVALKRLKHEVPSPEALARFLREAKIQARLDHPAIAPVYELGRDAAGRPYFAMKRLCGETMEAVMGTSSETVLLRALVGICLAIDFAHARGVIHRDVKPSNVVLGDYGEVYLLDWGVARVLDHLDDDAPDDDAMLGGGTQAGVVLGTPGYMAPEQLRGAEDIGYPADVYSLGAILFEILAGEPLHLQGSARPRLSASPSVAPSTKRASVAPELDALCTAALADDPRQRPTARALADGLQRYLDGDRDVAQRRKLAVTSLASARQALAADERALAMNAAGRAMALDPESRDAATLVTQLILEPPRSLPTALKAHLDRVALDMKLQPLKTAAFGFLSFFLFLPLVVWNGVRDLTLVVAMYVAVAVLSGFAWHMYRTRRPRFLMIVLLHVAFMMLFSRVQCIFLMAPGIMVLMTIGMIALVDRPWFALVAVLVTLLVPVAMEWSGLVATTMHIENDQLVITSPVVPIHNGSYVVILICENIMMLVIAYLFGRQVIEARRDALHRLESQAWHLRALLPVPAVPSA